MVAAPNPLSEGAALAVGVVGVIGILGGAVTLWGAPGAQKLWGLVPLGLGAWAVNIATAK